MPTLNLLSVPAPATLPFSTAASSSYNFQPAACELTAFPELLEPGRRAVLLAVDPDLNGAVVALSWRNPAASQGAACKTSSNGSSSSNGSGREPSGSASSSSGSRSHGLPLPAGCALHVELHDMPTEVWQYGTRAKRQPAADGLIGILQRYSASGPPSAAGAAGTACGVSVAVVGGKEAATKKRSSGGKKSKKAAAADEDAEEEDLAAAAAAVDGAHAHPLAGQGPVNSALGQQAAGAAGDADPPIVRAVMEYNMPAQLSGKYAW